MSQAQKEEITSATIALKQEEIENMLEFFSATFGAEYGFEFSSAEKIGGMCFLRHIKDEIGVLAEMIYAYKDNQK